MVAQSQDRLGLPVAGEVGRDVAELSAVGDDGFVGLGWRWPGRRAAT